MAWWQRQFGKTTRGRVVALLRRGDRTVEELARDLRLTDNAVRAQLALLEREGVVRSVGIRRDGMVGKPAMLFGVAPGAAVLFSSAYAPLLSSVLAELGQRMSSRQLGTVLRAAGRRLAPALPPGATFDERARAGAAFLASMGADADLVQTSDGYEIRGHGCLLSEAVRSCPATCDAVEELLSEVTGTPVRERCDRATQPRCRFLIASPR
ncbi:MAG: regulatory protein ArsR [Gemmatimonadetes bacterium]|nr:regulatory protein ArsR [Gemmatimonadota bacterium]